jgi:Spy/CpxP family protein refolding chaperone
MTLRTAALALAVALSLPAHAQPAPAAPAATAAGELAAVRDALKSDKRAFVAAELKLTDEEAKRFWPVYDNYQRNLDATVRRSTRVIEEVVALDKPLTEANAKRIANELVLIDEEEAKDRRKLYNQLKRVLPPVKGLRYLQIENKARALRTYDIANALPLAK